MVRAYPLHRRVVGHFRHRGNHGGIAPTKNEIALSNYEVEGRENKEEGRGKNKLIVDIEGAR